MNYKEIIAQRISTQFPDLNVIDILEIPPNSELGDFALPCFSLAKSLKKSPVDIAKDLAPLVSDELISATSEGPYVNFLINAKDFVKQVISKILSEKEVYGSENNKEKTIVIDYSGPNVAKNMGIHNLRSTIIGQALVNSYRFLGYNVVGVNHLGDWGTQFGKLIWALEKWSNPEELQEKGILFLNQMYVKFHEEAEKQPEIEDEGRAWFKKIEDGDARAQMWWKLFVEISLEDYNKIYKRLNINFDDTKGESFYIPLLDKTIQKLEEKKLTSISEGALVVDFNDEKMPPCLLKKSDGATLYGTRDLAAALYRLKEYNPYKILYAVDIAQELHFKQVFRVLELLDQKNKDIFEHIKFGRLSFPDGGMSTRKGNIVPLNEVLDKAKEKVLEIIQEKNPKLENKEEVAEMVGCGAVIFGDLSQDRIHNIIFEWDKVLDFQGETAPYVQYTIARINSIMKQSEYSDILDYSKISGDDEKKIAIQLDKFNKIVNDVINQNKPHHIAKYAIALSQQFNNYYSKNKILHEDPNIRNARIQLIYAVSIVLTSSLKLLGITAPEEM